MRAFNTIKWILCAYFACLTGIVVAGTSRSITDQHDLILGEVNTIYQSKDGFVWFAGFHGVVRFDGYDYRRIHYKEDDDRVWQILHVYDVVEDHQGGIWIGAKRGIFRLGSDHHLADWVLRDAGNHRALDFQESTNTIIASRVDGLTFIDEYGSQSTISTTALFKPNEQIVAIETVGDSIFVGTNLNLYVTDSASKAFSTINLTHLTDKDFVYVSKLRWGQDQTLWLGTDVGLVSLDLATRETNIVIDKMQPDGTNSGTVFAIDIDSEGNIWAGFDGKGVCVFDTSSHQVICDAEKIAPNFELTHSSVRSILLDENQGLWVGYFPEGIQYVNTRKSPFKHYQSSVQDEGSLPHDSVLSISLANDNEVWLGTDGGGVARLNLKTGHVRSYQAQTNSRNHIGSNAVLEVARDAAGTIWVGCWGGGVSYFDERNDQFVQLEHAQGRTYRKNGFKTKALRGSSFWAIHEDAQGAMWFGSHLTGLSLYDRQTQSYTNFMHDPADDQSLSENLVWDILEDVDQTLWVATSDGFDAFDESTLSFRNYVRGVNVFTAHLDINGEVWLGTEAGLMRLNDEFRYPDTRAIHYPDAIFSVADADQNHLWLGTGKGFVKFNKVDRSAKLYDRIDGKRIGGTNKDAIVKDSQSGRALFGTLNGLYVLNESKQSAEQLQQRQVGFSALHMHDDVVLTGDKLGGIEQDINTLDTLELDYKVNMFSLKLTSFLYDDVQNVKYAYKLDGFNESWMYPGRDRTIKFTNLSPGKYTLKVRSSPQDGEWRGPIKSLEIIQRPAPWLTWWAYLIYGVMSLILLYVVYTIKRQRVLMRIELDNEKKLSSEYRRIDNLKNDYFANITHDMRGPLSALLSMNHHLHDTLREYANANDRKLFDVGSKTITRLLYLVNGILDAEKVRQGGEVVYDMRSVNLSEVIGRVISLSEERARDKGLEINNLVDAQDLFAKTDEFKIEGVIENLISNAIKYTDEGSISILAGLGDDDIIYVHIKDTGIGIAEENLDKVFESMFQDSSAGGRGASGTGLGLTNAKNTVEGLGGSISVKSTIEGKNHGTTFTFTLPADNEKSDSCRSEGASTALSEISIVENKKILLVDDEPTNLLVVSKQLQKFGHLVVKANNGNDALEAFRQEKFDMVLCDYMMPTMSGEEVCREIRKLAPPEALPFIFLSGNKLEQDLLESIGANFAIIKGVELKEIGRLISPYF